MILFVNQKEDSGDLVKGKLEKRENVVRAVQGHWNSLLRDYKGPNRRSSCWHEAEG